LVNPKIKADPIVRDDPVSIAISIGGKQFDIKNEGHIRRDSFEISTTRKQPTPRGLLAFHRHTLTRCRVSPEKEVS
jgi:hypothetical protein